MSKVAKAGLVPKLRFPEFRDAPGWEKTTLGDITFKTDKRNRGGIRYPVYSINNISGFVPQSDQFEGVDSIQRGYDLSLYKLIERNTFAYNPARINVGSIGYSGDLHNIIVSSLYVCFKAKEGVDEKFLLRFFETKDFEKSVNNNAEGGIRSYLFYEKFSIIKAFVPSIREQQKIAECLASLDALIGFEKERLEALKAFKKGLMQQLFPREGERVPRLRFPEFRGSGEWEETTLGARAKVLKGKGVSKADIHQDGKLPCIRYGELYTKYSEIISDVESKTNVASEDLFLSVAGDVIIPSSGETKEDIATASCVLKTGIALGGDLNVLRSDLHGPFLSFYLNGTKKTAIAKVAQGDTVVHLYPNQLRALDIRVPDIDERKAIAKCLVGLSEQQTVSQKRVEVLILHKQGLMQKLFPSIDLPQ